MGGAAVFPSPLSQGLGFLLSPTLESEVGVKSDARNSGAFWLFNPTPPSPHQKKKRKKKTKKRRKSKLGGTGTPLKLGELLATFLIDGDPDFFFLIVVKVTRVPGAFELWYEGCFHLEGTRTTQTSVAPRYYYGG